MLKGFFIPNNYAVTFFQTLAEIDWPPRLRKFKQWQKFLLKLEKKIKKSPSFVMFLLKTLPLLL